MLLDTPHTVPMTPFTQTSIGGYLLLSFVAVRAYLFLDAMSRATGGHGLPFDRCVPRSTS
ncbi:hypothetical protein [Rhodococcus sp. 14-1411-2a]|uniref:hypothetical protein n=1 Tax=Rhodococcus sp. 14-1411-2a TaxID=2023151 RepID=UPI000B9BDA81|nr:hypothetical protein [Rhodococcus sp. 14-1411-2a]